MGIGTFLYLIIYKEIKITEPLTCFNLQIILLKFTGSWKPDTDNKILLKLYSIYAFMLRILFIYLFIFTEIMVFRDTNDIQKIADSTFILTSMIAMGFKVINFNKKYERIRIIFKKIDIELFRVRNVQEERFLEISMTRTLLICVVFLIPATMTVTGLSILPLFDKDALHFPLPAWFPFDTNPSGSTIVFVIVYIYQIIGLIYCSIFVIASDTFIMGLISIMDANIKILGHRFEQIGYCDQQCSNQSTSNGTKVIQNEINRNNFYYYEIVKCIINHEEIIRYIREFELIFREAIFAQILASVIIVCMAALQLLNAVPGTMKFFTMFLYLGCMLWQIFIYCWIGNEVIYSSIKLCEKAYFCHFHIFDKRTKNALILFMQRTTHEITIMAGGLFQILLSLQNFVDIVKASYTYLAVLRNVQSGKKF